MTEARIGERRSTDRRLDFSKIDPRIAQRLSKMAAQVPGTMPQGWMGSFHKQEATVEDFGAPEWDKNMITYARKCRELAQECDVLLSEVEDTPENRLAIYSTRRALLSEADMYYDEVAQRPGVPLALTQHWWIRIDNFLKIARDERKFSAEDQRKIIIGRLQSYNTELETLLGFVRAGGWKSNNERVRFCEMILANTEQANKENVFNLWQQAGGDSVDLDRQWDEYVAAVKRHHAQFFECLAPAQPAILGEKGVKKYLEGMGLTDTPEEIIAHCEKEASALRAEMERLSTQYPEVLGMPTPKDDVEVKEEAEKAKKLFTKIFIETGMMPDGASVDHVRFSIRDASQEKDLNFASWSSSGEISCLPASFSDAWKVTWASWRYSVIHELTHEVQNKSTQIPKGFMSQEAEEGAAVILE
ncbi:MAG: hypothetical protein KIH62_001900 [Candidatus Kerfeldbacteria bacterium]|nr:hypothetical protein [Candidatus Kerfeldbacteria bacterium]